MARFHDQENGGFKKLNTLFNSLGELRAQVLYKENFIRKRHASNVGDREATQLLLVARARQVVTSYYSRPFC